MFATHQKKMDTSEVNLPSADETEHRVYHEFSSQDEGEFNRFDCCGRVESQTIDVLIITFFLFVALMILFL